MLARIWFGIFVAGFMSALYRWLTGGDREIFTKVVNASFDMAQLGVEVAIGPKWGVVFVGYWFIQ